MAQDAVSFRNLTWAAAAIFLLIGATALVASEGKHLSWALLNSLGAPAEKDFCQGGARKA